MTQFSLFGAQAAAPQLADLDGVLLAGGHWVRSASGAARLSVVVDSPWRAGLALAFADRGVSAGDDAVVDERGMLAARTCFHDDLVYWAQRWTRGARQEAPPALEITAGALRLWTMAGGRRDDSGYLLSTAQFGDRTHVAAGSQLARLGLAGVSIGARGGPGWRVTSAKRLGLLRELVGVAPDGAGDDWP